MRTRFVFPSPSPRRNRNANVPLVVSEQLITCDYNPGYKKKRKKTWAYKKAN